MWNPTFASHPTDDVNDKGGRELLGVNEGKKHSKSATLSFSLMDSTSMQLNSLLSVIMKAYLT